MKAIKLIILFLCIINGIYTINAQNWLWSKHVTGTLDVEPKGLAIDTLNNPYMFGVFSGEINFGFDTLTSFGGKDIFLAKFNEDGSLLWLRQCGGTGNDQPKGIVADDDGNAYITGAFRGTATFQEPDTLVDSTVVSVNHEDIFLAKYSSDGTLQWVKNVGWGDAQDRASDIILDQSGNIAICGFFKDSIYFESESFYTHPDTLSNFIAKFDDSGNFLWAKQFKGTSSLTKLNSISACTNTGFYIGGYFTDSLFIENDTLVSQGISDIILFQTDATGAVQWSKQAGSTQADRGNYICSDLQGNAYLTGYFKDTVLFDTISVISAGAEDIFIAKYDSNGNAKWVYTNGSTGFDIAYGIYTKDALLYFTGCFTGTTIWNNDTLNSSGPDLFIAIADTSGNIIKAKSAQGNLEDKGQSIVVDNNSDPYISGYFLSDTLFLYNDTLINAGVTKDLFLAKYSCPVITLAFNVTEPSCFGLCDGSATVIPSGGAEPYSYLWDGGQTNNPVTGLCAGTYCVTVTDANNCIGTDCVTITQPPVLTASITDAIHLLCNSVCIGSATVTPVDGTPPYTYQWDDWFDQTDSTAINLCANNYSVTVTDTNGCITVSFVTITEPALILTSSITDTAHVHCSGSCVGSGTVTPVGGTSPYIYIWSDVGSSDSARTGLCEGVYAVIIVDNNFCSTKDTLTILLDTISVNITEDSNITCYGNCDGALTVTVLKGNPPYSYLWDDALSQTTATADSLCAGNYTVTVTDIDGCTATGAYTLTQPDTLTSSITDTTHISCFGLCDGSATVTPVGGIPPYSYSWADGATDSTATNLCAGTISVTPTDANGCTTTAYVTITQPASLTSSITDTTYVSCYGLCDGSATVTPVDGTPPYTYLWSDGQSDSNATNLCAGSYDVTVTDANLCTTTASVTITEPSLLTASITDTTHLICNGVCIGSATVTPVGGTSPYLYSWNIGTTDSTVTNLCAGTYCVIVTDANLCTVTECVTITEPDTLTASIIGTDIACNSDSDGVANLIVSGGTSGYTYIWNYGQTTQDIVNLAPDTYCVTVTDTNLCTATECVTITEPPPLLLDFNITDATCQTCNDGSIDLTVTGGTPLYSYFWSNDSITEDLDSILPGTYTVTIADANGCDANDSIDYADVGYPSSINEIADNSEINIYPNPTDGFLYITYAKNIIPKYIRIYNIIGENVVSIDNPDLSGYNKIDMSAYAEGTYIVKILLDNKEVLRTVVLSTGR